MTSIVASRPATLAVTFYAGTTAVADLGDVTATLTRDDGDAQTIAADPAVVDGTVTITLTPAEVGDTPDRMVLQVDSTTQGRLIDVIDVVGRRFVDLSAIQPTGGTYTDARLDEALTWFEDLAEEHTGTAWRPRYAQDRFYGTGDVVHVAAWPELRHVLWATVDGEDQDVSSWDIDGRRIRTLRAFTAGAEVRIGYLHGHDQPPPQLVDACIVACRDWLRTTTGDRRVARVLSETDQFGNTARMARANTRYPTGIDVVDRVLNALSDDEAWIL